MNDQEINYSNEKDMMIVSQHLAPEQYEYEFPPKRHLKQLDYHLDETYFDESTISSNTVYSSVLVDDSKLSPLQLPSQIIFMNTNHTNQKNLMPPVGPSSFLSENHMCNHVTQSKHHHQDVTIILIHLDKNQSKIIQQKNTHLSSYELESESIFCPILSRQEQLVQSAIKIQSLWRGYQCRKLLKSNDIRYRLKLLEKSLHHETAMRIAFEKTMENMTILIDQQQKVFFNKLENEIQLRRIYENKLTFVENKLENETNSRVKLEDMLHRVLEQLDNEDDSVQLKIDELTKEVDTLKQKQQKQQQQQQQQQQSISKKPLKNMASTATNSLAANKINSKPPAPTVNSIKRNTTVASRNNKPITTTTATVNNITSKRSTVSTTNNINNNKKSINLPLMNTGKRGITTPLNMNNKNNNNNTSTIKRNISDNRSNIIARRQAINDNSNNNKIILLTASSSSSLSSISTTSSITISSTHYNKNNKKSLLDINLERPSVIPSNRRPFTKKSSTAKPFI